MEEVHPEIACLVFRSAFSLGHPDERLATYRLVLFFGWHPELEREEEGGSSCCSESTTEGIWSPQRAQLLSV